MKSIPDDLRKEFEKRANEGGTRTNFAGIKLRLYFGEEKFKETYEEYLSWRYLNFKIPENNYTEAVDNAATDYDKLTEYIESRIKREPKELFEKLNEDRKNNKNFFDLLKQYINVSLPNEKARKKYQNSLITANDSDPLHCFFELIRNADDCEYEEMEERKEFTIDFSESANKITVTYNEKGMDYTDIISLTSFNESNKANNVEKIGEKGQGFKTLFNLCERVEIDSGGFSFQYKCTYGAEEANITIEKKTDPQVI